jgi:hypothetical protein
MPRPGRPDGLGFGFRARVSWRKCSRTKISKITRKSLRTDGSGEYRQRGLCGGRRLRRGATGLSGWIAPLFPRFAYGKENNLFALVEFKSGSVSVVEVEQAS